MKPQITGNIGFFKGVLLLMLFNIPTIGPMIMLALAIFNRDEVGRFARIILVLEIVLWVLIVGLFVAASFLLPDSVPDNPLHPGVQDGVEALVSGLVGRF